jgi:hypothetical protein
LSILTDKKFETTQNSKRFSSFFLFKSERWKERKRKREGERERKREREIQLLPSIQKRLAVNRVFHPFLLSLRPVDKRLLTIGRKAPESSCKYCEQ